MVEDGGNAVKSKQEARNMISEIVYQSDEVDVFFHNVTPGKAPAFAWNN